MTKRKTSFALSDEAMELLRIIAKKYAISMTAVLEIVIRDRAVEEGIRKDDTPPG